MRRHTHSPDLTVTEWANLVAALKPIIERYGLGNVSDAIQHLVNTGGKGD